MPTVTSAPCARKVHPDYDRALGTSVTLGEYLDGKRPVPGDPKLWASLPPLPPLPPPKPPGAVFDRDRLVVTAGDVVFDLRKMEIVEGRVSADIVGELLDVVEDAAFEVFAANRMTRALATGRDVENFDLRELLDGGHFLDWEHGAIHPPQTVRADTSPVRPLFEIWPDSDDSDELIFERYLERGGSLLIAGNAGIGKSSLALQFAIGWALRQEVLGFAPTTNIASLIIQAENADSDIAAMRDGVARALELDEYSESIVNQHVAVVRCDEHTGQAFRDDLVRHVRRWNPDVIFLDPVLAFVGGDLSKQEVASAFLRQILQPIARRARAAIVALHHTGKPRLDERRDAPLPDYLGFGSSELANWPRAIAAVTRVRDQRGVFRLQLGKRGQNLEWRSPDGSVVFEKTIAHSAGGIFWRELDATQEAKAAVAEAVTPETLFGLVPDDGSPIGKDALISLATERRIGVKKATGFLAQLLHGKRLHEWLVPRPKTGPAKLISRVPQPPQMELQKP